MFFSSVLRTPLNLGCSAVSSVVSYTYQYSVAIYSLNGAELLGFLFCSVLAEICGARVLEQILRDVVHWQLRTSFDVFERDRLQRVLLL